MTLLVRIQYLVARFMHGCYNSGSINRRQQQRTFLVGIILIIVTIFYFQSFEKRKENPFDEPFCSPNGICHEIPYRASPRTHYSAWNQEQYDLWWKFNNELNERVVEYAKRRKQLLSLEEQNQKTKNKSSTNAILSRPFILLGDSITESWLGTGLGIPKNRAIGIPTILQTQLVLPYNLDPLVLAISGDQTQHLLYRLDTYLQYPEIANDSSSIFVLMIGTNNLGSGELPQRTAKGIVAVLEYLLQNTHPNSAVLLFHILPRGDGHTVLPTLCPPRCTNDGRPYTSFLPAIQQVNDVVEKEIWKLKQQQTTAKRHFEFVNCGIEFLYTKNDNNTSNEGILQEVQVGLMPDLLHPNAKGHEILAKCIQDFLYFIHLD